MIKKIILICLILLSTSACSVYRVYKTRNEDINIYFEADKSRNWVVSKLGKWKKKYDKRNKEYFWLREQTKFNFSKNILSSSRISIKKDSISNYYKKSYETIQKFGDEYLLYVGNWQYVEKIGKEIRLISTNNSFDNIMNYFETKDENNKNIPYRPFKLPKRYNKENGYKRQGEAIGEILWFDKYGYNSYLHLRSREIRQTKE